MIWCVALCSVKQTTSPSLQISICVCICICIRVFRFSGSDERRSSRTSVGTVDDKYMCVYDGIMSVLCGVVAQVNGTRKLRCVLGRLRWQSVVKHLQPIMPTFAFRAYYGILECSFDHKQPVGVVHLCSLLEFH